MNMNIPQAGREWIIVLRNGFTGEERERGSTYHMCLPTSAYLPIIPLLIFLE